MYASDKRMKFKQIYLVTFLVLVAALLGFGRPTKALDSSFCGVSDSANTIVSLESGQYDVYAKLGKTNVSESAEIQIQPLSDSSSGGCARFAPKQLTSSTYTKVADAYKISDGIIQVFLSSLSSSSEQSAAAPQVIFVPHQNPPCQLSIECTVTYESQNMRLSPKKLSLTSSSLRVGILLPIGKDKIKTVIYSVDGKPAYESEKLETFNERYVSGGEHTLGRRVVFESGASLSDSRTIERGTSADVLYYAQSLLFGQSKLIKIAGSIIALLILWSLTKGILRLIQKRRIWKQTHIAAASSYSLDRTKVGAQAHFYEETIPMTLYRYRKILLVFLGLALGMLITSVYVVGVFTVDGVSMFPTLQDRSVHPLVKFPKTVATINRSAFVPKRGDIVVLIKDENNLFDPEASAIKNYVVKRTVGLPGERIVVKNGVITVYNKQHDKGFVPDEEYKWVQDLKGSEDFSIDITLKDSELFVVGDNRDESIDSRFYGPIDTAEVVGKVVP